MTTLRTTTLFALLLATTACTQPSAQVENKGTLFFGKNQIVPVGDSVPGQQPASIAAKYQQAPIYAEPTPIVEVEVANMDEPSVVEVQNLEPLTATSAPMQTSSLKPLEALPLATTPKTQAIISSSHFSWPVQGEVLSHFGPKSGGMVNDGINIAASEGEPIWAAAGGEVAYAGASLQDYGNMVIVRHEDGWMSAYGHASDLLVKKGDTIKQGDLLGYVGQTGSVDRPQLHFGLRQGDTPIDPLSQLPRRVASAR